MIRPPMHPPPLPGLAGSGPLVRPLPPPPGVLVPPGFGPFPPQGEITPPGFYPPAEMGAAPVGEPPAGLGPGPPGPFPPVLPLPVGLDSAMMWMGYGIAMGRVVPGAKAKAKPTKVKGQPMKAKPKPKK